MNTPASLLNLGWPDMVIIMGIMLLLFGAKKLPDLARGMGEAMRELGEGRGLFKIGGLEIIVIAGIALLLIAAGMLINARL